MNKRLCLLLAVLSLPLAFGGCLFAVNSVNPMALIFVSEFVVENRTGDAVVITPLGRYQRTDPARPLPLYACYLPALPALQVANFAFSEGESRTFWFDSDDIGLSEFLVEDPHGQSVVLEAHTTLRERRHAPRMPGTYVIPPLAGTPRASPEALDASSATWNVRPIALTAPSLVPMLLFGAYFRKRRSTQERRSA